MHMEPRIVAKVAAFSKNEVAHGLGVEISLDGEPYAILSLYLLKSDYPSKRKLMSALFSEVFKILPENDEAIRFVSTLQTFKHERGYLETKSGIHANGRPRQFYHVNNGPRVAVSLAIDAVERKTSIIEVL